MYKKKKKKKKKKTYLKIFILFKILEDISRLVH